MQHLLAAWQVVQQKVWGFALIALLLVPSFFLVGQSSYASTYVPEQLNPDDQVERGYDAYGEDAGTQEDIYQQRLQEGQNPEKMPKPYNRVRDITGKKEVPETSLLETSVSKARGIVDRVTGK